MMYTFDEKNENAPTTHTTQYFEMFGDRAIYHDGWIASTKVMRAPWDHFPPKESVRFIRSLRGGFDQGQGLV
jgi:arylsulfatase